MKKNSSAAKRKPSAQLKPRVVIDESISQRKFFACRNKRLREKDIISYEKFTFDTGLNVTRTEGKEFGFNDVSLAKVCKYYNLTPQKFFMGYNHQRCLNCTAFGSCPEVN